MNPGNNVAPRRSTTSAPAVLDPHRLGDRWVRHGDDLTPDEDQVVRRSAGFGPANEEERHAEHCDDRDTDAAKDLHE
jgi:hypothetical protein